ncbi:MAG TPA: hypothetical protein VL633_03965 [Bacteroidota bacterium]|jgi:hypothetical protein|nr:hypothetical protein [Bacteroidota bacterium]
MRKNFILSARWLTMVALLLAACKSDSPNTPPPCSGRTASAHGEGTLGFLASGRLSDSVAITGRYVLSSKFQGDAFSEQGAGGFVGDVMVSGKPLRGTVAAFAHVPHNTYLYERILTFAFYDSTAPLSPGAYALTASATGGGMEAESMFYFADSIHPPYSIYRAEHGMFTFSLIDTCARRIKGTFTGTFTDISDTSAHVEVSGGTFDIDYSGSYFVIP